MSATADRCTKFVEDAYARVVRASSACLAGLERTCCRGLFAKTRVRSCLLVGLDATGKTSILMCLAPVRKNLYKWAKAHGVEELFTMPTCSQQLVKFQLARSTTHRWHRRAVVSWRVWDMREPASCVSSARVAGWRLFGARRGM